MVIIKADDKEQMQACNQVFLCRNRRYCGENVLNLAEYVKKRVEINNENQLYKDILQALEEKKTDKSFIGIWQLSSDVKIGSRCGVRPLFLETTPLYKCGNGAQCYAQTAYYLLESLDLKDAEGREIYKDCVTGIPFVFDYTPGSPEFCATTRTDSPK